MFSLHTVWMAFRREAGEVHNWCYQEYFKLPDFKSVDGVFSGHFPGPCSSLQVEDRHVYWTDAGWRGRWNALRSAVDRVEKMWENGNRITNAAVISGAQHVLLSNGKLDSFTTEGRLEEKGVFIWWVNWFLSVICYMFSGEILLCTDFYYLSVMRG